ncbi:hypothetical protein JNB_18333 [Janibacter sp. HTCC2649]|uniref:vWA domain-containing protein n=1 Tax=Janibacter sp. HTCC2649 TaxID=313589 RepID=UPI0000670EBC|nr:VWA domain-containing protein [Janibacter sp. HTCC2649]EAP97455.1 hypothetical protein JNB_18333 [Janibacter sp. HTCC2649]
MRILAALTTAVMIALTGAAQAALPAAAATASDEPVPGKLLLMLDASGSMKAKDPSGLTKIEAAKRALTGVVGALPDTAQVGLRVYGAKVDGKGKPTPAACADTQLVHPIATLDKPKLTSTIAAIKALGETPIAHSLTEALKDLGTSGKRNIVLVSDGEESCVPDPCPAITKLTAAGVDLQIDTVGFGVNTKARAQLQCIAAAGKGTYYDAKDASALTTSLSKLSQRALRAFTVSGTPVKATEAPAKAPEIKPGQYVDTFVAKAPQRHILLRRTPGSTVRLSLVARPPRQASETDTDTWELSVSTPEGVDCTSERAAGLEFFRNGQAVTLSATVNLKNALTQKIKDKVKVACASSETLLMTLSHPEGASAPQPVELVFIDEPPVAAVTGLPAATEPDAVQKFTAPATGSDQPVLGGGAFSDAVTLAPGSYTDTVMMSEQLYYRVKLDFGQRAAFTVEGPAKGATLPAGAVDRQYLVVGAWTPSRSSLTRVSGTPSNRGMFSSSTDKLELTEFTPEVRYLNRESFGNGDYHWPDLAQVSMPGYYYFAISRNPPVRGSADGNVPLPIRIRVAVSGEPNGQPAYAGTSPDASASPSTSPTAAGDATAAEATDAKPAEDEGSGWLLWVGLGLVAVLGALGAAYVILRTRLGRRTDNDGELQ